MRATHSQRVRTRSVVLLLASGMALILASCEQRDRAQSEDPPAASAPSSAEPPPPEECPNETSKVTIDMAPLRIPIARQTQDIKEFHDCQKLILRHGGQPVFGPLLGLWANESLNEFDDEFSREGGVQVAHVLRYDPQGGTYPNLNITGKHNCLYLELKGGEWTARMYPGANERCDITGKPDPSLVPTLFVRRASYDGLSKSDIPAAARWQWDATINQYTIGVKCMDAWCEISGSELGVIIKQPTTPEKSRRVVQGWFDEQELAVKDANGTLKPSGVVAQIFPQLDLEQLAETDFEATWKQVATIKMSGDIPGYPAKLGLYGDSSTLWLIRQGPDYWKAKIVAPNGTVLERKVTRMRHPQTQIKVPGAARWRWVKDDDLIWVRCGEGCCEVEDEPPPPDSTKTPTTTGG